jgi:hypothetical protein
MLDKIPSNSIEINNSDSNLSDSCRFQAMFGNFRVSSVFINDSNLLLHDKSLLGFNVRTNTSNKYNYNINTNLLDIYLKDPDLIVGAQYNENAIKSYLENINSSSSLLLKLSFISYFNSKFFLRKTDNQINNSNSITSNYTVGKCDTYKEIPSEYIMKVRPINFKNAAYNDLVTLVFREQTV